MPGVTLNLEQYRKGKEAGTARVVKLHGTPHLTVKAFNQTTGEPEPQLVPISLADAEKQLESMKADLATLQMVVDDIKGAKEMLDTGTPAS